MDDDDFGPPAFSLFEASLERSMVPFTIKGVTVQLECVFDDPGALQSGHFLWPGARFLADFLEASWSSLPLSASPSFLELGSGCGFIGLVLSILGAEHIVLTDYEPLLVELASSNMERHGDLSASFLCEEMAWGSDGLPPSVLAFQPEFDMVVASDVIYSLDVIEPLLRTVSVCLRLKGEREEESFSSSFPSSPCFLMVQSFPLGVEEEERIERVCGQVGLTRTVFKDTFESGEEEEERMKISFFVCSSF